MKRKNDFVRALQECEKIIKEMGLILHYTYNLDPFYKGDLDGKNIFIGDHLSAEEKLFNLVHLAGHSIQWNLDELLRTLGSKLYLNPDDELLQKLQTYEWQASCYGLTIMHKAGITGVDKWLYDKYVIDMMYLTHFYKTGKKLRRITNVAKAYPFKRELTEMPIPVFNATAHKRTRNGLVIAFD